MESAVFRKLLTDLYNNYNPDKLVDVDRMVSQYNGTEFDAIKTIYLKYNFKQSPFYNPTLGSDKQVRAIMEKYNSGNMRLEEEKIDEPEIVVKEEIKEKEIVNKMPFTIVLKFNFEDYEELILPDLSNFLFVSIGQRMIFKTKNGGVLGTEVISVLDDYFSHEEESVREIIIDKV